MRTIIRIFMYSSLSLSKLLAGVPPVPVPAAVEGGSAADSVLAELKAGNLRFVEGRRSRSRQSEEERTLRETLVNGQNPQAVIITCSDSRLSESFIFDQELGRLFTIRGAGNSPDIQDIASTEYAVKKLGCQVVVIMGHSSCGAVGAVAEAKGAPLPFTFWAFQASMAGLLESTPQKAGEEPRAYQDRLAQSNAIRQCRAIVQRSEMLREQVSAGKLKVVPAFYDLATGKVTFLREPPGIPAK